MNHLVAKGVATDLLLSSIAVFATLISIPIYLNYLANSEYGLWLAISSIIAIVAFLDIGVDQHLTNSAITDANFYDADFGKQIKVIVTFKFVIVVIMAFVGGVIIFTIKDIIDIGGKSVQLVSASLAIAIINLCFGMYLATFQALLFARKKFSIVSICVNVLAIGNSVLPIAYLKAGFNILSFPLANLTSTIIATGLILWQYRSKEFSNITLNPLRLISISTLGGDSARKIIRYTASFQIMKITSQLRTHALVIMINGIFGPAANTSFSLCSRLPGIAGQFASKLMQPLYPFIGENQYSSSHERSRKLLLSLTMVSMRLAIYVSLVFVFLNIRFVELWTGANQHISFATNYFLVINAAVLIAFYNFGNFLYIRGKFGSLANLSIIEIVGALMLGYLLSFHFGMTGIIAGFTVASLSFNLYMAIFIIKDMGLSPVEIAVKSLRYSFGPSVATLIVLVILDTIVSSREWGGLLLILLVTLLAQIMTREFWVIIKYRKQGFGNVLLNLLPVDL